MEAEEALPGASRCSPFRRVARFFPHRPRGSERRRRRDRWGEDGRQGNVINFKRDFYCGRGAEGRGLGLEFALTSDALSAV